MTSTKRKVTISVDQDALTRVSKSGKDSPSLSAYLNQLVLDDLALDRQREQIFGVVADYEAMFGEINPARVEHFKELLS